MKKAFRSLTCASVMLLVLSACGDENEGPSGTSSAGGSSHNSSRSCGSCHGNIKYSGTLYTDIAGSTRATGVTVTVTETDDRVINMVSNSQGAFYTDQGNPGGGYTVTVEGNTTQMVIGQTNGGCNVTGCHDGSTTPLVYQD